MSSDSATQIQDLLNLYAERKNAQGGVAIYTRLELITSTQAEQKIRLEGLHEDVPLTDRETSILASSLFRSLGIDYDGHFVTIAAAPKQMIEHLTGQIDNVVVYPQTENFRTILSKLLPPNSLMEEAAPYLLPYPRHAKPLGSFVYNDLRGFYTYDARLIDASSTAKGAILEIPYYKYDKHSTRIENIATLSLATMGLKIPFSDSTIQMMRREVAAGDQKLWFPKMVVPADGKVGFNTLSGYSGRNSLQIAIMEEPDFIAATFARFADKSYLPTSPVLLQSLKAG